MALVKTFLLIFFLIFFYNNFTFTTCSRKLDNNGESRSFIGFGTHTATERICNCSVNSMCNCCQVVTILYKPLQPKTLCFNMVLRANDLTVDLSLDLLIMNSMTVANYRPFQMCAKIPGSIFSKACVSITDIRQFPGPSVYVCPRMELSTKKESWIIPYICPTLSANGTSGMGMMVVMPQPGMPGAAMMPAGATMPMMPAGAMPMIPSAAAMTMAAASASAGAGAAAGMRPAMAPAAPAAMGATTGMVSGAFMAARPPAPAAGAMMPAAAMGMGAMAPAPGMAARPPATGMMPAAGMMSAAGAPMGPRPPATPMAAASNIVPRITGAAGSSPSPVLVFMMNQNLASALETVITEASASMAIAQENRKEAESRFDSGLNNSPTDLSNDDEEPIIVDLSNSSESYEQNLKKENATETEGRLKNLKRKKRNYDLFDVLHQSNRCERAYRICITRTRQYVVSRLKNTKQNIQVKNDDCEKLVKIVHEPSGNLCTQTNWNGNTTPVPVISPALVSHDSISNTDDTLGAIVIQDEYSEGSDFHPQNDQYPIPLLTYSNAEMYPSRIPPIALKELLGRNSNISILQENLDNDKSVPVAVKN